MERLFFACDTSKQGVIQGSLILRLLEELLGEDFNPVSMRANLESLCINESVMIDYALFCTWASHAFAPFQDQDFNAAMEHLISFVARETEEPPVVGGSMLTPPPTLTPNP